jgi:hypothetical protein
MSNALMQKYLDKRIDQPTVILCFRILLENVIENGTDSGLTKQEIAKVFNRENRKFGITKFRTDYVLRQKGAEDDSIYLENDKLYIKDEFLTGLKEKDFISIVDKINAHFQDINKIRKELIKEITKAIDLSVEDRKIFIMSMLLNKETEKKGQAFEVTSFAILKVFYSIRGFELNRFSTIYSNDGGIDFTSQTSIYQVTTLLNDTKFADDIIKAPLKKRIFVFRKNSNDFDFSKMDNDLISDYITVKDLENHLDYLISKRPEINSGLILGVILDEFKREHYL